MEYRFHSATISKLSSSFNMDEIYKIMNNSFDPLISDEGFLSQETYLDKIFYFQYLRKVPITYGEYDNGYLKKTETVIKETNFQIDFNKKMIVIFSGKKQSDFLLKKISNIFKIPFFTLDLNFLKLLDLVEDPRFIVRSEQVVINGFNYHDLMVGKYIANIKDKEILKTVIKKYQNNVEKIKLSFEDYNGNVSVITINRNGSFVFNNSQEENIEIILYFVHLIFSGDLWIWLI